MRPASTSSLWGTGSPSIAARRGRRTSSLRSLCRRGIPPSQEWGYRPILHPPSAPPGSGFRLPQRDESLGAGHRVVYALGAWSAAEDGWPERSPHQPFLMAPFLRSDWPIARLSAREAETDEGSTHGGGIDKTPVERSRQALAPPHLGGLDS